MRGEDDGQKHEPNSVSASRIVEQVARSPQMRGRAWWPLVFSLFALLLFVDPIRNGAEGAEWALTTLGVVVFMATFVVVILAWHDRRVTLAAIAFVALLGYVFAPLNVGACVYVIFAASTVPLVVRGDVRRAAGGIGLIVAPTLLESWLLDLPWQYWSYSVGYSAVIGAVNVCSVRQMLASEHLAKMRERDRIARDLHDVLGHSLSLIILKAELAGRLLHDQIRAREEIGDIEEVSRRALTDVRRAIRGYRADGLRSEFERAQTMLGTAGVVVQAEGAELLVAATHESVLALVLREAVTNVVRHARARTCRLRLGVSDGSCRLEISDDGRGGWSTEGEGLRGMRERVEALGGSLIRDATNGTTLILSLIHI